MPQDQELNRLLAQYSKEVQGRLNSGKLKWEKAPPDDKVPAGTRIYMAKEEGFILFVMADNEGHVDGAATIGFSNFHLKPEDASKALAQADEQFGFTSPTPPNSPPLHKCFDLIAPIAIMHFADVTFKDKAAEAIIELHSNTLAYKNIRAFVQKDPSEPITLQEMQEYYEHPETDKLYHIGDIYRELFAEVVHELHPHWQVAVDKDGSLGFRDEDGHTVFFGDQYNCYPWYETAELLVKRIRQYEHDAEKEERE